MTKAELVAKMATASGVTKVAAGKALDGCLAGIRGSLRRGEAVTLVGFGTFKVSRRRPRKGRSQTGQWSEDWLMEADATRHRLL